MKKLLTGASAAALLLTAGVAAAQTVTPANVITSGRNFDFKVDGFFTGGIGFVDTDDDKDEVGLIRNSEVIFVFELVADNGLTFGAETQLEAGDESDDDPGTNIIDENFAYVQGSFGEVQVGENDGAKDSVVYDVLVVPPFASSQDGVGMLFDYYSGDTGVGLAAYGSDTGDALKLSYFTPSFSGFRAGVSYAPEVGAENGNAVPRDGQTQAFEVGASYTGDFGGFSLGVSAGYATDTTPSEDDDSSWHAGIGGGAAGFAASVFYGFNEAGGDDESTLGVGVAYGTGPWQAGADYTVVLDGEDTESDMGVAVGVSYAVAPGVNTGVTGEFATDDSESKDSIAVSLFTSLAF